MLVKNRIKKHSEFKEIIDSGNFIKTNSFNIYYKTNELGYLRIGISVPKKSGNAVVRNKIKRQVSAIFAKLNMYTKPYDFILIIRKAYNISNYANSEKQIYDLFTKIG